jgi:phospholipid transport system substrate-binding protein
MKANSLFFSRRAAAGAVAGVLFALGFGVAAVPARAEMPAEAFVRNNVQRGLTILNDHNLPDNERRRQFRDFLTSLTDIRRIALFTLGAARRSATPDEVEAFVKTFRDYAVAVYESRLAAYSGQTLRVTGGTEHAPGDDIVTTVLVESNGSTGQQPIEVDFRVANENGRYVVLDLSIAGVWLALEERDQFSAFLEENRYSVPALVTHLAALTQRLRTGGPSTPAQ